MNLTALKGYILVILSGLVIFITVLLVVLQWGLRAEFSLFGQLYTIHLVDDRLVGGINTALLMVLSGIGGVVSVWMIKLLFLGISALRKARRRGERQAKHT